MKLFSKQTTYKCEAKDKLSEEKILSNWIRCCKWMVVGTRLGDIGFGSSVWCPNCKKNQGLLKQESNAVHMP